MKHPVNTEFASSDLALALNAQGFVTEYDDLDPELMGGLVEEEEEEEEDDPLDLDSMTDEELNALSPEELAKLRGDHHEDDGKGDDDPEDEDPEDDPEGDGGDGDGDGGDGGDGKGDDDDDPSAEELEELLGGKKGGSIPYARFKEVNDQGRADRERMLQLEEENARLRGSQPPKKEEEKPKPYDFDGAEDRYMDAVLDGDKDKAKEIRREIRAEEKKLNEAESRASTDAAIAEERARAAQDREAEKVQGVLVAAYEKYPFLDHTKAKTRNMEAIQEVIDLRDAYVMKGMPFSQAVDKAANVIGRAYAPAAKPGDDKGKGGDGKGGDDKGKGGEMSRAEKRGIEQKQKNATAEERQPERMNGSGQRERLGQIDIEQMSDEQFSKLTKEELSELRGDNVKPRRANA